MRTAVENWQEDALTGHTHEPNDVTVQLDGLGRKLGEPASEPPAQEGSDGPVFVDESGRRSKKFRRAGWVLAAVCACYAVTLVTALVGGSSTAPWLPGISQFAESKKKEKVEVEPAPSESVSAGDAPAYRPGAPAPTDSTGAVLPQRPSGTASSGAPKGVPAARGAKASAPAAAKPSSGGGVPAPGGGPSPTSSPGGGDPVPEPVASPVDPSPSPSAPTSAPVEPPAQEGAR